MLPLTPQFSNVMEFCPSITSASEWFAVSAAFFTGISAVVVMTESEMLTVVPLP